MCGGMGCIALLFFFFLHAYDGLWIVFTGFGLVWAGLGWFGWDGYGRG